MVRSTRSHWRRRSWNIPLLLLYEREFRRILSGKRFQALHYPSVQRALSELNFIPIPMTGISACEPVKGASTNGNPAPLYEKCLEQLALFYDTVNAAAADHNEALVDAILDSPIPTDPTQVSEMTFGDQPPVFVSA